MDKEIWVEFSEEANNDYNLKIDNNKYNKLFGYKKK